MLDPEVAGPPQEALGRIPPGPVTDRGVGAAVSGIPPVAVLDDRHVPRDSRTDARGFVHAGFDEGAEAHSGITSTTMPRLG